MSSQEGTSSQCFDNNLAQFFHKYLNYALALLVSLLSWWFVNLDARVARTDDTIKAMAVTNSGERVRQEEILRRLSRIEERVSWIQERSYLRRKGDAEAFQPNLGQ